MVQNGEMVKHMRRWGLTLTLVHSVFKLIFGELTGWSAQSAPRSGQVWSRLGLFQRDPWNASLTSNKCCVQAQAFPLLCSQLIVIIAIIHCSNHVHKLADSTITNVQGTESSQLKYLGWNLASPTAWWIEWNLCPTRDASKISIAVSGAA